MLFALVIVPHAVWLWYRYDLVLGYLTEGRAFATALGAWLVAVPPQWC